MGGLFGGKPKKPNIQEPKQFAMYDANKHTANVKPLDRNPGLLGGPGMEKILSDWDAASKQLEAVNKGRPQRRGKPVDYMQDQQWYDKHKVRPVENRVKALEDKMWAGIYQTPAGFKAPGTAPAPAPAPAAAPKPAPAPAPVFTPPAPESSPAAAAAGTIVGTQLTGTMGADTAKTGTKRGSGRRGRVKSLLSGLGGSGSETFGG
jgi:hypothetical protein